MPEDFIKYGLIPEFIGRVPVVVTLDSLDENALVRILKEPKNSLVRQYQKLMELDGVELVFDDSALIEMARKALERKTGARGLRSIMEKTMMDLMFESPSDDTIQKCEVTAGSILGLEAPRITRGEPVYTRRNAGKRNQKPLPAAN